MMTVVDFIKNGEGVNLMDMNTLRQERIQLFKDAIQKVKKPDRVPHFGNLWSWKIQDAGYKLTEALYDYEIMQKVLDHTYETYQIDCCYETGWRNPTQVTESLGNNEYIINNETNAISIKDQCIMASEEYDELISNPKKFLWEKVLPRKYKLLRNQNNVDDFRNTLGKYNEFGEFMRSSGQIMCETYGLPIFADPNAAFDFFGNGYEFLFNFLRGIKGISKDISRDPDRVIAAIEALDETFVIPRMERAMVQPKGTNMDFCVDINPVLLGHAILGPKQFEKFYWPHLKRIADYAVEQDKLVYFFVESDSKRFWDFFQELPKNHFAIHVELDDIFEMKKRLPNIAVAGGMKTDLLANGTPEQCVDYAKKLLDELAGNGGYIFSENKMISFKRDCKSENLKAVSNFVREYRP